MFSEGPGASKPASNGGSSSCSLLQQMLQEDEADMSELYFGGLGGSAEGQNSPEAVAWRQKNSSIQQNLLPLPKAEVGNIRVVVMPHLFNDTTCTCGAYGGCHGHDSSYSSSGMAVGLLAAQTMSNSMVLLCSVLLLVVPTQQLNHELLIG